VEPELEELDLEEPDQLGRQAQQAQQAQLDQQVLLVIRVFKVILETQVQQVLLVLLVLRELREIQGQQALLVPLLWINHYLLLIVVLQKILHLQLVLMDWHEKQYSYYRVVD
jgi:hypothetical protein